MTAIILSLTINKDVTTSIWKGIEFEIAYYKSLMEITPERRDFYQSRITTSQAKLDKAGDLLLNQKQSITAH
jgi:DNA-binding transcriptional regulator PaaX